MAQKDPYTEDTAYMRFNLVRLASESFPKLTTVAEVTDLMNALAVFVSAGNEMPDPPEDDEDDAKPTANVTAVASAGQYL